MGEFFALRLPQSKSDFSMLTVSESFHSTRLHRSPKFLAKYRHSRIALVPASESGRNVSNLEFHVFASGILLLITGLTILLSVIIMLVTHSEFIIILPYVTLIIIVVIYLTSSVFHFTLAGCMTMSANNLETIGSLVHFGGVIICLNIVLLATTPIIGHFTKPNVDSWKQHLTEEVKAPASSFKSHFMRAWDFMQNKLVRIVFNAKNQFNCCGVQSMTDWGRFEREVPRSCCKKYEKANCQNWHDAGCSKFFFRYHRKFFNLTTGISVIAIVNNIIALTMLLISSTVSKKHKKELTRSQTTVSPLRNQSSLPNDDELMINRRFSKKASVSFKEPDERNEGKFESPSPFIWVDKVFPEVRASTKRSMALPSTPSPSTPHNSPDRVSISSSIRDDPIIQIIRSVSGPEIVEQEMTEGNQNFEKT